MGGLSPDPVRDSQGRFVTGHSLKTFRNTSQGLVDWRIRRKGKYVEGYTRWNKSERQKIANRKYYQNHREEVYARSNARRRAEHKRVRDAIFELLGGKRCVRCGYDADERALQFDHINGGGTKDKKGKQFTYFYKEMLASGAKGIQVLCANCNVIKKAQMQESRPYGLQPHVSK